jgi:hypothetical protein
MATTRRATTGFGAGYSYKGIADFKFELASELKPFIHSPGAPWCQGPYLPTDSDTTDSESLIAHVLQSSGSSKNTRKSRAATGIHRRAVVGSLIIRILEAVEIAFLSHVRDGGATVSLSKGNLAGRKLFAVSTYPERTTEIKDPPTRQQLFAFIVADVDPLFRRNHALGTWFNKNKGVHVLDLVVCLRDRDKALDLGRHFGQQSIFDLAAGREIQIESPRFHRLIRRAEARQ